MMGREQHNPFPPLSPAAKLQALGAAAIDEGSVLDVIDKPLRCNRRLYLAAREHYFRNDTAAYRRLMALRPGNASVVVFEDEKAA